MNYKALSFGLVAVLGLSLAVATSNAFRGVATPELKAEVQSAVEANAYELLPAEVQERVTEEQFAERVVKHQDREAIKEAIDAGDYEVFVELAPENMLERIADEAEFDALVARKSLHEAHRQEVETIIAEGQGFEAFAEAMEEFHAEMEEHRPDDKLGNWDEASEEEKLEKLQRKYDKMSDYYAENGEFPEGKRGMYGKGGHRGKGGEQGVKRGMGGQGDHFGARERRVGGGFGLGK